MLIVISGVHLRRHCCSSCPWGCLASCSCWAANSACSELAFPGCRLACFVSVVAGYRSTRSLYGCWVLRVSCSKRTVWLLLFALPSSFSPFLLSSIFSPTLLLGAPAISLRKCHELSWVMGEDISLLWSATFRDLMTLSLRCRAIRCAMRANCSAVTWTKSFIVNNEWHLAWSVMARWGSRIPFSKCANSGATAMMEAFAWRSPSRAKASRSWSSVSLLSFHGKILCGLDDVNLLVDVEAAPSILLVQVLLDALLYFWRKNCCFSGDARLQCVVSCSKKKKKKKKNLSSSLLQHVTSVSATTRIPVKKINSG